MNSALGTSQRRRSVPAGPAKRQVAVKSTRGFALKSTHGIAVKPANLAAAEKGESAPVCRTTRQFYDGEESCYIIDAKLEGNLGRYLNVSRPNGGRDGATGGGVRAALPGKTLEPPPRVLWLSRLSRLTRPGGELPLPAPLTLPRSRYSTAAAPTSSCRTCSWTRTTCASPGSPSSPASESHRVWLSPRPGVPGADWGDPPPPRWPFWGDSHPFQAFPKGRVERGRW